MEFLNNSRARFQQHKIYHHPWSTFVEVHFAFNSLFVEICIPFFWLLPLVKGDQSWQSEQIFLVKWFLGFLVCSSCHVGWYFISPSFLNYFSTTGNIKKYFCYFQRLIWIAMLFYFQGAMIQLINFKPYIFFKVFVNKEIEYTVLLFDQVWNYPLKSIVETNVLSTF